VESIAIPQAVSPEAKTCRNPYGLTRPLVSGFLRASVVPAEVGIEFRAGFQPAPRSGLRVAEGRRGLYSRCFLPQDLRALVVIGASMFWQGARVMYPEIRHEIYKDGTFGSDGTLLCEIITGENKSSVDSSVIIVY